MTADDPLMALRRQARHSLGAGHIRRAVDLLESALPDHVGSAALWGDLGDARRADGQTQASLDAYERALDLGIDHPEEIHLIRGVILMNDLARAPEAETEFLSAVSKNPQYVAAWFNLGSIYEDRGSRADAQQAYGEVLRLEPGNPKALARLVGVSELQNPNDPLLGRLRALIANRGSLMADRAIMGFALGEALDRLGAYDAAFEAFKAANEHSRAAAGPHRVRYDRVEHERFVDRLISTFPRPVKPIDDDDAGSPIFICGMFRSGSTLVERILAAHPQVTAGGELHLLPAMIKTELQPYPDSVAELTPSQRTSLRRGYLDGLKQRGLVHGPITDKRPDNFLHIGLIKQLFPTAKIIHTTRQPLDNCLSIYFLNLTLAMPYALDLLDTGHWLGQHDRLMGHWRSLYGEDILTVSYDDLVHDPRTAVGDILAFCGLAWNEDCLNFHQKEAVVRTASLWQVRKPIYAVSSGRWRNYEAHLIPLRSALGLDQPQ